MPRKFYTRFDEARRRLRQSLVRYNNRPVYVTDVFFGEPAEEPEQHGPLMVFEDVARGDFVEGWRRIADHEDELTPDERDWLQDRFDAEDLEEEGYQWAIDLTHERLNHAILIHNRRGGDRPPAPREVPEGRYRPELVQLRLTDVRDRTNLTSSLTDESLNLAPVKLGMMRQGSQASYIERVPNRRCYKQGLESNVIRETRIPRTERGGLGRGRPSLSLQHNPDLCDTIEGRYPTLREALAEIAGNPETKAVPFNRHLAVEIDTRLGLAYLWYKRAKIGWSEQGSSWNVGPEFQFMNEFLVDKGLEVINYGRA